MLMCPVATSSGSFCTCSQTIGGAVVTLVTPPVARGSVLKWHFTLLSPFLKVKALWVPCSSQCYATQCAWIPTQDLEDVARGSWFLWLLRDVLALLTLLILVLSGHPMVFCSSLWWNQTHFHFSCLGFIQLLEAMDSCSIKLLRTLDLSVILFILFSRTQELGTLEFLPPYFFSFPHFLTSICCILSHFFQHNMHLTSSFS